MPVTVTVLIRGLRPRTPSPDGSLALALRPVTVAPEKDPMPVTVTLVDHPLVADSLARIRDRDTPNSMFRTNLERIGTLLLAEATRSLRTVDGTVETPLTTAPRAAGSRCSR